MKKLRWIFAILLLCTLGIVLNHMLHPTRTPAVVAAFHVPTRQADVVATVKTVPLKTGELRETVESYGTVVARASAIANVAVPFESQALRVLVSRGQQVLRGEPLVQVEASQREILLLAEARRQARASAQQLAEVLARFNLRLATRHDLLLARQTAALAALRLANLQARGIGGPRIIKSTRGGLVARISVEPGQIVPAGGPLLQLVSSHDIEVRLGVEPEDALRLAAGHHARLFPVGESRPIGPPGIIRLITHEVDPRTRLVNVFVRPPADSDLLLGQFIRAKIVLRVRKGLLVPPSAVLPFGSSEILYTVHNGRARRHRVTIQLSTDYALEITGHGLVPGEPVIVSGNAELTNGMAVTGKFVP